MDHHLVVSLVADLLIVLSAGFLAGAICRRLGASILVGYLTVGALIGTGALGLVREERHELEYLAETGVLLLLFSIGIEFSLEELRRMGRSFLVGGATQMVLVGVPAGAVALALGQSRSSAVLIGAATAFSSTVLVFKALEEWGQTMSPHGRRAIGILLFQDAALVPLILLMPLLTVQAAELGGTDVLLLAGKTALLLAAVPAGRAAMIRWVAPSVGKLRSVELLVLFTVIVVASSTLGAYWLGLPPMLGAFGAGLMLNGNRLTRQIDAVILPFRETFAAIFFVSLGTLLRFEPLSAAPLASLGVLLAVVAWKALAGTVALRLTGLQWSAAMGMGLGLAQIGEFAFVLLLTGLVQGIVDPFTYNLMMFVAVGTVIATPLLLRIGLRWAERAPVLDRETAIRPAQAKDAIPRAVVVGIGPVGARAASQLETKGYDACLIDLSPVNLHPFAQQGFRTIVGNAAEREVLTRADTANASLVVIAVPDDGQAERVAATVREVNETCSLVVRCRHQATAQRLRRRKSTWVVSEEAEISRPLLAMLEAVE